MQPRVGAAAATPRGRLLRWISPTEARLRLSARVRPQSPLELMLCDLFRCQREWSAKALVAQLAQARAGSERQGSTSLPVADAPDKPLAPAAARQVLERWIAQGVLVPVSE